MTAPTTPIDADVSVEWNPDMYFVLESEAIWRTENLTAAGAATWEQVYDPDADFDGAEFGGLLRIRCAASNGLVYVIGYGEEEAGTTKPFCLKSTNFGETWEIYWIEEEISINELPFTMSLYDPFTMSNPESSISESLVGNGGIASMIGKRVSALKQWPECNGGLYACTPAVAWTSCKIRVLGTPPHMAWPASCDSGGFIYDHRPQISDGYLESYTIGNPGIGTRSEIYTYYSNEMGGAAGDDYCRYIRFNRSCRACQTIGATTYWDWIWEIIEWDGVALGGEPKAFDVAKTNSNWLYLGLTDKILKSEDGGVNWSAINVAEGANDILVDMLLAGVIYYWSTDGNLKMMVADAVQSLDLNEVSAWDQHLRIAQMAGGRLYTITGGGDLKMRYLGSWSTLVSSISGGRCLRVYNWDVAYLDATAIWHSDDWGASWEDKTGDWADYVNPVTIHYLDDITG